MREEDARDGRVRVLQRVLERVEPGDGGTGRGAESGFLGVAEEGRAVDERNRGGRGAQRAERREGGGEEGGGARAELDKGVGRGDVMRETDGKQLAKMGGEGGGGVEVALGAEDGWRCGVVAVDWVE